MNNNQNTQKINFDIVRKEGDFLLAQNYKDYFIFCKSSNETGRSLDLKYCTYYSQIYIGNEQYEGMKFRQINDNFADKLFELIISTGKDLPKSVDEIANIFSTLKRKISTQSKRGWFAELYSIANFGLRHKTDRQSIYDMLDKDGNDIEIKSYSKVKREVKLTYQQITNNPKAKLLMIEVSESSEGQTLQELYEQLPLDQQEIYSIVSATHNLEDKFVVSNHAIVNMSDITDTLVLPKNCKDATFTFDVDLIINKAN